MPFAPVAPIQVLEELKARGDFGYYHLFLAHHTLEHPDRFRELAKPELEGTVNDEAVYATHQRLFIMDNSIVELGSSCTAEVMAEACQPILDGTTERDRVFAVLPDVMGDGAATRKAIAASVAEWHTKLPKVNLMAVAQGSNWLDYCATIDFLEPYVRCGQIKGIGIPRVLVDTLPNKERKQACFYALLVLGRFNPYFHLLGFSDNVPEDLLNAVNFGWSIDSAVPLRCSQEWHPSVTMEPRPKDWFDKAEVNDLMLRNLFAVRDLIG